MKFWLVRGKDNKVYITLKDEEPTRRNDYATGWNIGWPGTAYIENAAQLFGLFGCFYNDVRDEINNVIFPMSYESNPVEIDLNIKMRWYG